MADASGQDMLSPYHAMGDNPVSLVDPTGMQPPKNGIPHLVNKNDIPPPNPLEVLLSRLSPGTIRWMFGGGDPAYTPFGIQDWGTGGGCAKSNSAFWDGIMNVYNKLSGGQGQIFTNNGDGTFSASPVFNLVSTGGVGSNQNTDDMPPWTKNATTVTGKSYGIKYELVPKYYYSAHGGYYGSGMRIDIHYTGSIIGYDDVNWIQSVYTNSSSEKLKWALDGRSDALPYYYPSGDARAIRLSGYVDLTDNPNRDITVTNYCWIAVSSMVGFRDGQLNIFASFVWGYINVGGLLYIIPPSPISTSQMPNEHVDNLNNLRQN